MPGAEFHNLSAGNSGAGAILLAEKLGAAEIILIGYDCQHTGGRAHWHTDHPPGMGNAGAVNRWPGHFAQVAHQLLPTTRVINASRQTALDTWPRQALADALKIKREQILINGMGGMGDCLHQRAIVRAYMRTHKIYLRTPWPELYHDLRGENLLLLKSYTKLRTQAKNANRATFDADQPRGNIKTIEVRYPPQSVRTHRGVLPAMAAQCGTPDARDFSLPVPDDWQHGLNLPTDRPVIVYRPLVERTEWTGCWARNPNADAYVSVLRAIRDATGAYIISVADVEPGKEWITSKSICADLELHHGELSITQLCALWRDADLIYTAPGFGLVLAQSVGTPVISLFGGYERAYSFRDDEKTCKIEPENPCDCFTHHHRCGKNMDTEAAKRRALEFLGTLEW